jgi:universal stress protein A
VIGRVLVALDNSPRALLVLAAAAEIGVRFGATLTLFRALAIPPIFPPPSRAGPCDPLPSCLTTRAEAALQELASTLPPEVVVERPVVRIGQSWRSILEVADELDVDLIVIGSHGCHGFDRVLGTTTDKIASRACRNVLVVHDRTAPTS